jgi:hypothetical protein
MMISEQVCVKHLTIMNYAATAVHRLRRLTTEFCRLRYAAATALLSRCQRVRRLVHAVKAHDTSLLYAVTQRFTAATAATLNVHPGSIRYDTPGTARKLCVFNQRMRRVTARIRRSNR